MTKHKEYQEIACAILGKIMDRLQEMFPETKPTPPPPVAEPKIVSAVYTCDHVKAKGGVVEDEQLWPGCQRKGECQLPALPLGQTTGRGRH